MDINPETSFPLSPEAILGDNCFDEETSILRLIALASALSHGQKLQDGLKPTHHFYLEPRVLRALVDRLQSDAKIAHEKLHFEYNFSNGVARFKMPESLTHCAFKSYLSNAVTNAVTTALPLPDHLQVVNMAELPIHRLHNNGRCIPDAVWTIIDEDANPSNRFPIIAAEVAYSHPPTVAELSDRVADIIENSSDGAMSAVIAVKLFYDPTRPSTAILEHLDQCFVSVWESSQNIPSLTMDWTSFNTPHAEIHLQQSWFLPDEEPLDSHNRRPPIRIPLTALVRHLQTVVCLQSI